MQQQRAKRKTGFVSLRLKLLVGFTLIFSLVFAIAFYWFYRFATDRAMDRIRDDLVDTLLGTNEGVDGDQLQALYTEGVRREDGYTDDPRYWEQVEWFATVKRIEPRAKLYTYIKGEKPDEIIFITSAGAILDPPFGVTFLEHWADPSTATNLQGLITTTLELEPYTDDWGSWVSGYTPIRNSKGEVVAALGIDFLANYVIEVQQAIRDKVVVAFAVTYAALFVLVFLVTGALSRPIVTLTRAAGRIGEGDYEQDLSHLTKGRFPDEIDTLAEVFGIMVGKVYQREQTLRRQVEELKIEIDEVKRKKQVSEIVESDFFQDLQAKARRMRSRGRSEAQSESQ